MDPRVHDGVAQADERLDRVAGQDDVQHRVDQVLREVVDVRAVQRVTGQPDQLQKLTPDTKIQELTPGKPWIW